MKATLEFDLYETPDGKPTCALNVPDGKLCKFLRTEYFGLVDVCSFTDRELDRDDYWVTPCEDCPLWRASHQND